MLDLRLNTLNRLEAFRAMHDVAKTKVWLSSTDIKPLTDRPIEVRVHDILSVWQVRLKIGKSKGHSLEGGNALVARLEQMHPQIKLEQIGFAGRESMGNIFFKKTTGEYVGSVRFAIPLATEEFRKAS